METDQGHALGLATVGIVTVKKGIVNGSDFLAGKAGEPAAADRVIQQVWSDKKTDQLREYLTKNTVLVTMPSTTRMNVVPIQLAQYLSRETGVPWVNGDSIFNAKHGVASKNISRDRRVFNERKYSVEDPVAIKILQQRKIIIIDDIITTGSSLRNFSEYLKQQEVVVSHAVGLMGDRRLGIDSKTEEKLKDALKQKCIGIDYKNINYITRTEAGGLIRLINNAKSDNAIRKITRDLHGIQRQGVIAGLERNPGSSRNKSSGRQDRGNVKTGERVSAYSGASGVEWQLEFIRAGVIIQSEKVCISGVMDRAEQLKSLNKLARKISLKNELGVVQVKMQKTGKVANYSLQRDKQKHVTR